MRAAAGASTAAAAGDLAVEGAGDESESRGSQADCDEILRTHMIPRATPETQCSVLALPTPQCSVNANSTGSTPIRDPEGRAPLSPRLAHRINAAAQAEMLLQPVGQPLTDHQEPLLCGRGSVVGSHSPGRRAGGTVLDSLYDANGDLISN